MNSLSARENEKGITFGAIDHDAAVALATRVHVDPYTPHETAYASDPKNDRGTAFLASIAAGATIELQLACNDGRRERVVLDKRESKRYVKADLDERIRIAETKIRERRVNVARAAATRVRESGKPFSSSLVSPEEEAYLREFGAIATATVPLDGGGYAETLSLREDGFFDSFGDAYGISTAPTQREYLPRGGPAGQQQTLGERWDALAKQYYAWSHDPIAHRGSEILSDFVVGRSVSIVCNHPAVQRIVDEFNERDEVIQRLPTICVSLSRDGDLFGRIIRLGDGRLKLRTLPPATIWDCVCDGDDISNVFWWVQRYQTRTTIVGTTVPDASTRWIDRTILASDMIHEKVNASETDVFGRGDGFAALGWMKRLRDYLDASVQKEYAAAAYQFHYQVQGGQTDVNRIAAAVSGAQPQPGQGMVTNDKVQMTAISSGAGKAASDDGVYAALVNQIAIAFGLSKDYFGAASRNNRASALIATEPSAKRFEQRQNVVQSFLMRVFTQVVNEARLYNRIKVDQSQDEDAEIDYGFRIVFPTIIKADSATRLLMLRQAEGMGYISHERAAREAAGEIEIDQYDYDDEMTAIESEVGEDPRKWIMQDVRPVKRGLPADDDAAFAGETPNPGLAAGSVGGPTIDGAAGSPTGAAGGAAIRKDMSAGDKRGLRAAARKVSEAGALVLFGDQYP